VVAQIVAFRLDNIAPGPSEIGGKIRKVTSIGVERVYARAPLGRKHIEEKPDENVVGSARPASQCSPMAAASTVAEQLVGRDRHHDFARLRLDEACQ
jgi:hypothetical protein